MKNRTEQPVDVQHSTTSASTDHIIETFPAGSPRGSWPAEEFAAARRAEGISATVVMNLATDSFIVKAGAA